ncbi:trypsin-like serine peptidase [Acetobacter sp.]|uniref:trypsin-like serine peptidase n=1 Tax=Acetobacter sp. TaxID=440 RepID=UPI0039E7854A
MVRIVFTGTLGCLSSQSSAAVPLRPGIGTTDMRQGVDVNSLPWSAIGRVQTELGARCTGFLIAPNIVETAAHCLFLPKTGHYIRPQDVHFLRAYSRGQFAAHAKARQIVLSAQYDERQENATSGLDRATLILDTPVATASQILPVMTNLPSPGTSIVLGGYEQDFSEIIRSDMACHVLGIGRDGQGRFMIRHDCSATRGSSGAPILGQQDGRWVVWGVQTLANYGQGGAATPLSQPIKDAP